MAALRLLADSYFDGSALHPEREGPYLLTIEDARIVSIDRQASQAPFDERAAFVMPGLVEAHAHLFLDGGELDFDKRNAYLNAPKDEMLRVARENIGRNAAAGVTLLRDAATATESMTRSARNKEADRSSSVRPALESSVPNAMAASWRAISRLAAMLRLSSRKWRRRPTTSRSF